jgi:hypothetical protein
MLVSASGPGEGAIVAARVAHDPWRSGIVLRASRVLSESWWSGRRYRPLFANANEVSFSDRATHSQPLTVPIDYHGRRE